MSAARPVAAAAPWAESMFTFGVTGTNGKTSTTWMIAAAVRTAALHVLQVSTLGVAFDDEAWPRGKRFADFVATLERAHARGCRYAVIETTSHALAQGYARNWRFDLGVFTNLSDDHFGTHGSWEHYLAAKAQLFMHLGPGRAAVLNAADKHALYVDQAIPGDVERRWFAAPGRGPRLRAADLEAAAIEVGPTGTRVLLQPSPAATALGGVLTTRMVGEVFGENALAAALAGLAAGLPATAVVHGIAACPVVPGRFEVLLHGAGRPTIAVDYAHSPDALACTCATARRLAGAAGRVIVVFGAGGNSTPEKRAPMGEAVGAHADVAVVTSDNPRDEDPAAIAAMVSEGLQGRRATWTIELDRARAIAGALAEAGAGDVVVIAGKGHEEGQVCRGQTRPFSDVVEVRRILGESAG
ncbi:Mur ligase family protein [Nannocystis pusilla]|uniref:UDP-N-acetylmuramyl-tripeptide synthetase n=1 Tax=Nannocystis pusilla TaxID=889268 RepID=A0ABS7U1C9_9BACT|nr:UDP-N-acetylmuramyl-tripeptide synthetase [Nannocystis pusilla]